jgi:D-alanine--poly(phosphoribitol) ligase subunit 2
MRTSDRVLTVLAEVAGEPSVLDHLDLPLYEQDVLDSLGTVELILAFEQEFGVDIAPSELDRSLWATPQHIVSFMEARVGK